MLNLEFGQNKKCQIYLNRHSSHTQKIVSVLTNKNIYFWDDSKLYKYNKKSGKSKLIFKSKLTPLEKECLIKILQTHPDRKDKTPDELLRASRTRHRGSPLSLLNPRP